MINVAIVLSGGTGSRLASGIAKQYIKVAGKMLVTYSLETLCKHAEIDAVLVVAEPEWKEFIVADLKKISSVDKIKSFVIPGFNRQLSIINALNEIKYHWSIQVDNILIHDAARPNLTTEIITESLQALEGHDGVMPALPMKDTVYLSEKIGSITGLLDRSCVYAGQAPETFQFNKYYEANKKLSLIELSKINGSTEPAIMAGMDIAIIKGNEGNYKITTHNDLDRFREEKENRF